MSGGLAHPTYYKLDFLHLQGVLLAQPCLCWGSSSRTAWHISSDRQTCRCGSPYLQAGTSTETHLLQGRGPPESQKNTPKAEGNGMAQAGVPPGMLRDACSSQPWGMARDGLAELGVGGKGGFPEGRCFPDRLDRDWPVLLLLAVVYLGAAALIDRFWCTSQPPQKEMMKSLLKRRNHLWQHEHPAH